MNKPLFNNKKWLLLSALLCCLASQAATAELAVDTNAQILQAAKAQLQAHDYAALNATLAPLLAEAEPHLEALFLAGMGSQEREDYPSAIQYFRAMLVRDPSLVRPRLELARVLQLSGDGQSAKYHYEQVMSMALPEVVMRNVYNQLTDIRERKPSLRMAMELTSDTNPGQVTSSRTVIIGGSPYTLNDSTRAKTSYGLRASADLYVPLPADPTWYARFYGEGLSYQNKDLDSLYAQASVGKRFNIGQHNAALELGGHISSFSDHAQYEGGLVRATGFYRLTQKLGLTAEAQMKTYQYQRLPYLNGENYTAGLIGIYVPKASQRLELGAGFNYYSAKEDAYTYKQPNVSARFVQEWAGGWITGARLQFSRASYDAPDPFFKVSRKETEARVEFDVLNRRINWWSFSPQASIGYVTRDSNLELYSYHRAYGRIGLTTEF